jgi:hypothetical protein
MFHGCACIGGAKGLAAKRLFRSFKTTGRDLGAGVVKRDALRRSTVAREESSFPARASVLSYIDVLGRLVISCASMAPMALLLQKPPKGMQAAAHWFYIFPHSAKEEQ